MSMFIYQSPLSFQFTKKLNNWNSEKDYLVGCGYLLVVCGRLLMISGGLWLFVGGLWSFAGGLWSFAGGLWSFAGRLWSFVVVACFSNYDYKLLNS